MSPHPSSSSDDIFKLPRVPRVRRSTIKDAASTSRKSTPDRGDRNSSRRTSARGKRNDTRSSSVAAKGLIVKRSRARSVVDGRKGRKRRSPVVEGLHSDDDENEESEGMTPPVRRGRGGRRRRGVGGRKVVEEEIDEEDPEEPEEPEEEDDDVEEEDQVEDDDDAGGSIGREEEDERKTKVSKGGSASEKTPGSPSDDASQVQEKEVSVSPVERVGVGDGVGQFESDGDEEMEEEELRKKPGRLTRRQRAMQGEEIKLEYTKLESPKVKKASAPEEEWSNDEEAELKRQQRARLRQMINEKRNKEKRAAMVDKVLRGVTSKRKKLTMASEERVAKVGTRLRENEKREGCIRFISNPQGVSLSIPEESEIPPYLRDSVKAVYPKACTRDPRTGKRIFAET